MGSYTKTARSFRISVGGRLKDLDAATPAHFSIGMFSVGLVLLVSLAMYRLTGSFTGVTPYLLIALYWYTFVNPIRLMILASFSIAILAGTAATVSYVTKTIAAVFNDKDEDEVSVQSYKPTSTSSERSFARSWAGESEY